MNINENRFFFQACLQFSWISGPRSRIIIKGSPLKTVYSILPSQKSIGVSVSVFTYADDIFISVAADSAIGEGFGETLLLNIKQQIDQMYELLRYRRLPKDLKSSILVLNHLKDLSTLNVKEVSLRLWRVNIMSRYFYGLLTLKQHV